MIPINAQLTIPDGELQFTFSRSSGPGGQNVNKVNSKATLHWNVVQSPSLTDLARQKIVARYGHRVTREGFLVVVSQSFRDQPQNIAACEEKLAEMIREALRPRKVRRPTKPTRGSRIRRLESKRHQSSKKQQRRDQQD
ncbi:MAG: alternative ribosome rescue aminoacyl-tRNA hydrolase ArfB [Pirellulaceae bacterium]